ncbi:FAD/NAD(P)-dependent oxidoreductase [Acidocella facilis]|uniref:FAD/NAD(P)-dependent oxidoreductase n=1 Tax=Acidocella facilis TaxID=525 RepID=UPI001F411771|nr:NAD(P)/FAD-dependent oxidoreductase [Acidocella facilis]
MSAVMHDALVIGAGPAGLQAAATLARHGADVVLLDEQAAPGGQIYRGIESCSPALRQMLGPDYTHGAALAASLRASGATYLPETAIWQVTPEGEVWTKRQGRVAMLQARQIIIATGALERPVPLPGWTLPGVMTAGAVQILLKSAGLVPDGLVLAGSGPLLYLLAAQCIAAGAPPAALVDTTSRAHERAALPHLTALIHAPARQMLRKGLALKAAIRDAGVKLYRHAEGLRIEGESKAQALSFTAAGQRHRLETQLIALHEGVIPHQQMTRAIGCAHEWNAVQHCFQPVLDEWGQSSVDNILVAGDAGGIGGALVAETAGHLAALAALYRLGRISAAARDAQATPLLGARRKQLALRPFLDALYAPRQEILTPPDEVMICRCEEVTAGMVRDAARQGAQGPNQVKSFLRAGMGPCQGRVCGPLVNFILAKELGQTPEATGYYRIRPPLKPITIGELADMDQG